MEAIKSINVPTKVRDVQRFVGLVNYYRYMWRKHAHTISPSKKLCSTKVKFKWTDVESNAFIAMKNILGHDVLLSYHIFEKQFIIHTDTSNTQLGGIIRHFARGGFQAPVPTVLTISDAVRPKTDWKSQPFHPPSFALTSPRRNSHTDTYPTNVDVR